ncbi:MAG: sigma-54-dependent Fis family transcriptional regulator [Candidatus Delongbacteria bacterium]|nr:sigma-54-dependent Fis family transcriptional regulator [Candidatus Delongbacteria bacterium]MBN2836768.1 sigma-54-dependent Fis family transcriptional regulator [Candidatus Delongbacteria bacterium]
MLKQFKFDFGPNYDKYNVIGKSDRLNEILTIVKTVAPTLISVLITGESGTGKEVISNLIHQLSNRKDKKFVAINCGAIPEGLIENELFGHEKGSYTSASGQSKGYFEEADGGTIFLDEIGELPLQSQVKLLRVLETGTFFRVGGTKPITVDVRVIAATNKNLLDMINENVFREDLYFRLKAVNLRLPSLSERVEDVPLFVYKFIEDSSNKHSIPPIYIENDAMVELINYHWKGNIRELKNFIDMLCVMEAGKSVYRNDILKYLFEHEPNGNRLPLKSGFENYGAKGSDDLIFRTLLEMRADINEIKQLLLASGLFFDNDIRSYQPKLLTHSSISNQQEDYTSNHYSSGMNEKEEIEYLLKKYNGNRRKVASDLGISERTLYRKLQKYELS